MVPTVELPPGASLTLQVTVVEAPSAPVTVAVKTCAPLVGTLGAVGATITTIFGGGGEDVDLVTPAQLDSQIAQTQRIAKHATGIKLGASRRIVKMCRAKICPARSRLAASPIHNNKGKSCARAEQIDKEISCVAAQPSLNQLSSGCVGS